MKKNTALDTASKKIIASTNRASQSDWQARYQALTIIPMLVVDAESRTASILKEHNILS